MNFYLLSGLILPEKRVPFKQKNWLNMKVTKFLSKLPTFFKNYLLSGRTTATAKKIIFIFNRINYLVL